MGDSMAAQVKSDSNELTRDQLETLLVPVPDALDVLTASAQDLSRHITSAHLDEATKSAILEQSYLRASSNGSADLLEWLLKQDVDPDAKDEDRTPAIILAASFAHLDCVRLIVEAAHARRHYSKPGLGINVTDRAGWTALHWAVSQNNVTLASFLLNHGARIDMRSNKGLTLKKLLRAGPKGDDMRRVLQSAQAARLERINPKLANGAQADVSHDAGEMSAIISEDNEAVQRQRDIIAETCRCLGISPAQLQSEPQPEAMPPDESFDWELCLPDQMLVFGMQDLPTILRVAIADISPTASARDRIIPASVIFFCARYACHYDTIDLLDELLLGSIETIEAALFSDPSNMANCAFWLLNSLVLLHALKTDPNLAMATPEYQLNLSDLINQIFVFVIRDCEQRIDKILDAAMLDYEPVTGFEDVRFEGEWRFVKALTDSARKRNVTPGKRTVMSLFNTTPQQAHDETVDVFGTKLSPSARSFSNFNAIGDATSPARVIAILSSTLVVMQTYHIHPSIVCQTFAQVFYWLACELSNRILAKRKYLCRSKAVGIRLNVSSVEEWARLNRLPPQLVPKTFAPLKQLLQWLQCLSSETTLEGLRTTIAGLPALNPIQLRQSLRDYRYEVDEGHMSQDCLRQLAVHHAEWEGKQLGKLNAQTSPSAPPNKPRTSITASPVSPNIRRSSSQASVRLGDEVNLDRQRHIDLVFSHPSRYPSFLPARGPDNVHADMDSRFMLPFALPSSANELVAFDTTPVFGPQLSAEQEAHPHRTACEPGLPSEFLQMLDAAREQDAHALLTQSHTVRSADPQVLASIEDWRARMAQETLPVEDEDIRQL
ncbi:uncharacterized protein L969DRAFT_96106 [Mixia osmundae IAM 14324]|uniref:Dilute domain-containing protein n=1 Tax=Mixia osmundae (strain CBS 9802 / IAM 14324 / JCM 22182 / KY 12970) TaxID=764103 RepID=G7DT08_MIXOS|nr:uncharacterized protein L969DRAFT_96106 [Mixia osmundae IAM 14324]KEI37576.1 hypothetical protein L969DRAFT_96106 [Mixia osmundae IAM 14324]GAA93718.1 hypothetical protein E5Q_00364 [Mixia osmundae IAM 14324]